MGFDELGQEKKTPSDWSYQTRWPSLSHIWQLMNSLHSSFNTAFYCQVDLSILNEVERKPSQRWSPFSRTEFKSAIRKCNDSSAPGPDKLTWRHLKLIIKNNECLSNIINIANSCINLGHWPKYFKISTTIVIPKLNKSLYNHLKAFYPIVLLNTLGKLIEKVVAERLQFIVTSNNFIHPSQLGVVATTRHSRTNDLTTSKALQWAIK